MDVFHRKGSVLKPDCFCESDLPHSAEHAIHLPQPLMPTLHLQDTSTSLRIDEKADDLLTGFKVARAEDLKLKEKFEERNRRLLEELKNVPVIEDSRDVWYDDFTPKDRNGLKYQLEHLGFQLSNMRNQIHTLKQELNVYRKLVRQEVGTDMPLNQLLRSKTWRGRMEEIERLKKEIARMEAGAYHHKYLKNPLCFPEYSPRFPRVEDLIPPRQAYYLKREALKRKEKEDEFEKEISSFMKEYGDLGLMYKASVTLNKGLADELRVLKQQHKLYEDKGQEDLDLIKKLVHHQLQMKELLDRETHLKQLVDHNQERKVDPVIDEEMDAAKYKALYEASEYKKQSIIELLQLLTTRLNNVIARTEEAYHHAEQNQMQQNEVKELFERKKEEAESASKKDKSKRKKERKGKQPLQAAQFEALEKENEFLRSFLQNEIEFKEKDLELYMATMSNIRKQYLETLEKVRAKKTEETTDLPETS